MSESRGESSASMTVEDPGARPARCGSGTRRCQRIQTVVAAAAWLLMALWVAWWVKSVSRDSLVHGRRTWVPTLPFLAGDFTVHIDHVARLYNAGINPYLKQDDWICALFPYPPMVLRAFRWVSLVSKPTATRIWLAMLSGMLAVGAYGAWRTRRALGISPRPLAVVAAALFYSTPAVMAMERGQCDLIVVPALAAAAWLLRRRTTWLELAAGGLLGMTAWMKYYPALAAVALLSLRRDRALAAFVVVAGLIGVVDRADVRRAIEHGVTVAKGLRQPGPIHPLKHSIVEQWSSLKVVKGWRPLRQVPAPAAAAVLLLPAVAVVSRWIARARERDHGELILPFMLWLTAAATYAMPYSNDYNLVALPLAALSVWDRRDPVGVHVVMGLLLLWWQPFALSVGGEELFVIKLAALYAVGVSLAVRACEAETGGLAADGDGAEDEMMIVRPHLSLVPATRSR